MKDDSKSDHVAWKHIVPRNGSESRSVWVLVACFLLCVAAAGWLAHLTYVRQTVRAYYWAETTATIIDARLLLVTQVNSGRADAMLYDVEVLAKYPRLGTVEEHWIRVGQRPESVAEAQLQVFRWKGKTCAVHWEPDNPSQPVAELN